MKDSKEQLLKDTLAFLRQEGLIQKHTASLAKPALKPLPKKIEPSSPPPPKKSIETTPTPKQKNTLLMDAIRKHLPHIRLLETIPQMQTVAILFEDQEELPFLTSLKNAIEERFCPCMILSHETQEIQSFTCVLTPKDRGHPRQIILAGASFYQDNVEEKRALWTQICQLLSPKSS